MSPTNTQQKPDEFETLGYFEELMTQTAPIRCLGIRKVETPDREFGYYGRKEITFTAPFEVQKGHKTVTVKATPQRPIVCWSMLQRTCGRRINE